MNNMNTPYEKMLNQIAELLQEAFDNADKPISPEKALEVEAQLQDLEKKVKELKNAAEQLAGEAGVSDYAISAMEQDPQSGIQAILKKAEDLKSEAEKGAQNPLQAAKELKEKGKSLTSKKSKKKLSPQGRKSKFRTMGGDQDWKPV